MRNSKVCKICDKDLPLHLFYQIKDVYGNVRHRARCKICLGIKKFDKITVKKTPDVLPKKSEVKSFIDEMNNKGGQFDFVDSLRLVDIFTRQYGIVWTNFSIEDELLYMWERMKEV
jgi:hypothetical protein